MDMISPVHELEAAALALPVEERARLAERLLSSLDADAESVEAAWMVEVQDRLKRFRAGELEAIPYEEVMAEARKRAAGR
jgi:putative addiction module component (TIGR02574 family)